MNIWNCKQAIAITCIHDKCCQVHFFTPMKTLKQEKVGSRNWVIAVIGLAMILSEVIWTLVLCLGKAVECFKHCIVRYGRQWWRMSFYEMSGLDQCISEQNIFSMLFRNNYCNILVKEVSAFCPYPKSLPESTVNNIKLIPLAQWIEKQPSIDTVIKI